MGRFPDVLRINLLPNHAVIMSTRLIIRIMPRCLLLLFVRTVAEQHGDVHELVGLDRVGEGQDDRRRAAQDHLETSGQASQRPRTEIIPHLTAYWKRYHPNRPLPGTTRRTTRHHEENR